VGGFAFKTVRGVCRSARRHLRKALQGLTISPHAVNFTPAADCASSPNFTYSEYFIRVFFRTFPAWTPAGQNSASIFFRAAETAARKMHKKRLFSGAVVV